MAQNSLRRLLKMQLKERGTAIPWSKVKAHSCGVHEIILLPILEGHNPNVCRTMGRRSSVSGSFESFDSELVQEIYCVLPKSRCSAL